MTLFKPNQTCIIVKMGDMDVYGQKHLIKRVRENCAVIHTPKNIGKSSVRTDSSASRGNANEMTADYVMLLERTTVAELNDLIEFRDLRLKITGIEQWFSVRGVFDHIEATCKIWNEIDD